MNLYNVVLSQDAENDLQEYIDYIIVGCKKPLTALRHYEGLFDLLNGLKYMPERFAIQTGASFLCFGSNVRRINYKKLAIIYTVHGNIVYILRIVTANLITSL
jgi:hypothetical protein